jgi:cytochrome P450
MQLPINALHYNAEVWGQKPDTFTPYRFVDNAKLAKSTSFRPWGGGQTICPGRFFAKRSVNIFVAILLSRYNLEAGPGGFPKADGAKPAPGMVVVGKGEDVMLICTPHG